MEKKYILTEETTKIGKHILHRIKAVRNFGDVKAGDLGGWVEREENLSHEDLCWVYDNAKIYGNAKVYRHAAIYEDATIYEDARIFGNASIYEDAQIYGDAWVFENAQVFGNTRVYDHAKVYGNARVQGNVTIFHKSRVGLNAYIRQTDDLVTVGPIGSRYGCTTFYKSTTDDIYVSCGCFNDTIDAFIARVDAVHKNTPYKAQYHVVIEMAQKLLCA